MRLRLKRIVAYSFFIFCVTVFFPEKVSACTLQAKETTDGFVNAADFGFSPDASGMDNMKALQRAVDQTGTIVVSNSGVYKMAGTVYIGDNTSLIFGNNVFLKKVNEKGVFDYVFLNKGALTKTYNEHISIEGLNIIVNGIEQRKTNIYGLRGQVSFFYIKDLCIEHFRCYDLTPSEFCIHVCTFEDIIIDDVIIKGKKDGIHLGPGNRFTIRDCVFQTFDDAIALNAHDYASSNPELGWIENGVVENCYDLDAENTTGYFCRILAGAWIDWRPGMEVQRSDAVISNGRLYRVQADPDGKIYKSLTRPTHKSGNKVIDGINWGMVQDKVTYTAGVRNVVFRDIFLEKPRVGFSVHFDHDKWSRSYYPGAEIPEQKNILFDNINVLYDKKMDWLSIATPVDFLSITNSSIRDNRISFRGDVMPDYQKTIINITNTVFNKEGEMEFLTNNIKTKKKIILKTSSNIEMCDNFTAKIISGNGEIIIDSDLPGLKK